MHFFFLIVSKKFERIKKRCFRTELSDDSTLWISCFLILSWQHRKLSRYENLKNVCLSIYWNAILKNILIRTHMYFRHLSRIRKTSRLTLVSHVRLAKCLRLARSYPWYILQTVPLRFTPTDSLDNVCTDAHCLRHVPNTRHELNAKEDDYEWEEMTSSENWLKEYI